MRCIKKGSELMANQTDKENSEKLESILSDLYISEQLLTSLRKEINQTLKVTNLGYTNSSLTKQKILDTNKMVRRKLISVNNKLEREWLQSLFRAYCSEHNEITPLERM